MFTHACMQSRGRPSCAYSSHSFTSGEGSGRSDSGPTCRPWSCLQQLEVQSLEQLPSLEAGPGRGPEDAPFPPAGTRRGTSSIWGDSAEGANRAYVPERSGVRSPIPGPPILGHGGGGSHFCRCETSLLASIDQISGLHFGFGGELWSSGEAGRGGLVRGAEPGDDPGQRASAQLQAGSTCWRPTPRHLPGQGWKTGVGALGHPRVRLRRTSDSWSCVF